MSDSVAHGWLQQNIRPLMTLVCLIAFTMSMTGVTTMIRGSALTEMELQIIWSVLGLYTVSRGGEKAVAIHKANGT